VRRFTPIELAIAFALLGSVLAVAIPAFLRDVHASRFVEPTDGLARLGTAAVAHAELDGHFPASVPLTPATVPRGHKEADPPGTWDVDGWKTLGFRPVAEGVPHAYAFSFEGTDGAFVARAHGDLDGDGVLSTFEIRGHAAPGQKAALVPGMYVESELE
jgi:hypothetical protein